MEEPGSSAGPVEAFVRPLRHVGRGFQPGWIYPVDLRDPFVKLHLAAGSFVLVESGGEEAAPEALEDEAPVVIEEEAPAAVPAWETDTA